jgi:hypothetical protein
MVDWTSSMQQDFEFYTVDPGTWRDVRKLTNIKSCSISRDSETDTLGSASFDTTELLNECYIRVYLVTNQNGVTERHPLGTFLAQTPSRSFDGKTQSTTVDAYTPLIELKENQPPIGFFIQKYDEVNYPHTSLDKAWELVTKNARAPVFKPSLTTTNLNRGLMLRDNFIAETNETWLSYIRALLSNADYEIVLDAMGYISFAPERKIDDLIPIWTYDDGNSSILYPDVSIKQDLFGTPNVVEITYSSVFDNIRSVVSNEDRNSPVSIPSRGRKIVYREHNPSGLSNFPSETEVDTYAKNLLKSLSTVQCSVTYTHGYCPVKLGDCVLLNYAKAGLNNVKAKVISQNIKCTPGCQVQETAVFNVKLWG